MVALNRLKELPIMEQDNLREWEHKCIQEEPPECTAACPIHVDARLFVKEMGRGDREAAFKVLAKTMPFPGILGRICDHPCELKCKRGEVEAADRHRSPGTKLRGTCDRRRCGSSCFPAGRQKIAVLGGGLAGLTAAWDLLKKGFGVTHLRTERAARRVALGASRELSCHTRSSPRNWRSWRP